MAESLSNQRKKQRRGSTFYASLAIAGHRETCLVRSVRFRAWLRRRYYEATQDALSGAAFNTALKLLEARAQFEEPLADGPCPHHPGTMATSISISPTRPGVLLTSDAMDGSSPWYCSLAQRSLIRIGFIIKLKAETI
jgi:hypothetical protein